MKTKAKSKVEVIVVVNKFIGGPHNGIVRARVYEVSKTGVPCELRGKSKTENGDMVEIRLVDKTIISGVAILIIENRHIGS